MIPPGRRTSAEERVSDGLISIALGMKSMSHALKCFLILLAIAAFGGCASQKAAEDSQPGLEDAAADTGAGADAYGYESGPPISGEPGRQAGVGAPTERVVYFDFDSAQVRADSRPIVEAHSLFLVNNPTDIIILGGNTDERGSREYNIALGERRGDSVRRLMIAFGVPPQQIRVVSYGEERPAVAGQNEADYAMNRRVEIDY